jgi:fatty acid kinase fatty acid binding subunit
MAVRIVTDTGANLPQAIIDEFNIEVVSGRVTFSDKTFIEYPELSNEEFYRRLKNNSNLPMARDPDIKDFRDTYSRIQKDNATATILSIHVSESLGTALNTARQAAALFPTVRVRLFDTRSVSFGQGMMVWEAARMVRDGVPLPDILNRLADMRDRLQFYMVVDTLDYLARGGRVGPVARLAGGLLDVKPVLTVRDGVVQNMSQHFTRNRALAELKQLVLQRCKGMKELRFAVMHAVCPEDAATLADDLKKEITPEFMVITEIGPAVGTHTGPGAIGVCWYSPVQPGK